MCRHFRQFLPRFHHALEAIIIIIVVFGMHENLNGTFNQEGGKPIYIEISLHLEVHVCTTSVKSVHNGLQTIMVIPHARYLSHSIHIKYIISMGNDLNKW